MADPLPAGFEVVTEGKTTLVLRSDLAAALRSAGIADPEAAAAAAGAAARTFAGRGAPVSFPVPGAGLRVVARRYLRGGILRGLAGDLFPGAGRFLTELRMAADLLALGVPGPEPLGVVVESVGAGAARGWFLSREVEDVEDLGDALRRLPPGDPGRRAALESAGRAVRRLHDAGVLHADLHLKNILVRRGTGEAMVLDLDGARFTPKGLSREQRAMQIQRLDRSLVKLTVRTAVPVSRADRRRLVLAYMGEDRPTPEEGARWRKKHRAHLARHRLGWRIGGG